MTHNIKFIALLLGILLAITQVQTKDTVSPLTREIANAIFKDRQKTLMLLLGDLGQTSTAYEVFSSFSNKFSGVTVTYTKNGDQPYDKLIQLLGLKTQKVPIIIYFGSRGDRFLFKSQSYGEVTLENIGKFIEDSEVGRVPIHFRSGQSHEDISEEQRAYNQKYLQYYTAYSLQDARYSADKQLVVMVYAQWCQYSKKLSPIFTNLAKILSVNPHIQFGKIEGPSNQIRGYQPTGYPEVLFWGSDRWNRPSIYYGQRSEGDLLAWVKRTTERSWVQPFPKQSKQKKIQKVEEEAKQNKVEQQL